MFSFLKQLFQGFAASGTAHLGEHMNPLEKPEELEDCLKQSEQSPVLIFKHSTRCPVSSAAYREMDAYATAGVEGDLPVYLNLVVESRALSNEIASVLGVQHASPQVLLVSNRKALWNASHGAIQADSVRRASAKHAD